MFTRKLNVKRYILSNLIRNTRNVSHDIQRSKLSNASLFNPPGGLAPILKVFRDILLRDLDNLKVKNANMSKELQEGLDKLCLQKDLIIRPVNKGGGIVVLDKDDYLTQLEKIVSDRDTYTPLKRNLKKLLIEVMF